MGCLNAEIYTLEPDPGNSGVGIIMKTISLFLLLFIFNISLSAKEGLTIYTYDSFISEWGPGPIVEKIFEEKFDLDIKFVSADSAATLLTKIILEGSSTKADIALGLDMNLLEEAKNTDLFSFHNIDNIENVLSLPISWKEDLFVPYNYGYFAFVYNNKKFINKKRKVIENARRIISISENTKKDIINYYNVDEERIDVTYLAESLSNIKSTRVDNLPEKYLLMSKFVRVVVIVVFNQIVYLLFPLIQNMDVKGKLTNQIVIKTIPVLMVFVQVLYL